jgi:hypothetical protein
MIPRVSACRSKSIDRFRVHRSCASLTGCTRRSVSPQRIVIDNGPEFTGRVLEAWAFANRVELHIIRAGKPLENVYIKSFNGKFRDECLIEHWFQSLAEAQSLIEAWRRLQHRAAPRLARPADPAAYAAAVCAGPAAGGPARHLLWRRATTYNPGGTHIIRVADLGGRSGSGHCGRRGETIQGSCLVQRGVAQSLISHSCGRASG